MATLGGDLIRMLAHGGISTLGNVGGELFKQWLNPAGKLVALKEMFDQAGQTTDPKAQQAILGRAYEEAGIEPPMVERPKVQGFAPPGLEPSVGTPNPLDTLLQTQSQPSALEGLIGAQPVTKGETVPEAMEKLIAVREPTLESWKSRAVGESMGKLGPLGAVQALTRLGASGKVTDMQRYIEAVNNGDTKTVDAIEKFYGGRNAVRAMYSEFLRNPEAVGGFYDASKPSDLTRTIRMAPGTAAEVGDKATAMQPQVPLVTSAGEPTGKTVPKGSTVLPKPEAITQKAPSIEEQIQDADKRIVDLTKTLGSTGWKTKDAKEALIKEIDAQKAHKESLLNKVGQKPQPITMRNKKTGEVKVFKSIEEANAFMGK